MNRLSTLLYFVLVLMISSSTTAAPFSFMTIETISDILKTSMGYDCSKPTHVEKKTNFEADSLHPGLLSSFGRTNYSYPEFNVKVALVTIGGTGFAVTEAIKRIAGATGTKFKVYFTLNYLADQLDPNSVNGIEYHTCMPILQSLNSMKGVEVYRFRPAGMNSTNRIHEDAYVAKWESILVNKFKVENKLPIELQQGCIFIDGIFGPELTDDPKVLTKLQIPISLMQSMSDFKKAFPGNVRIISYQCPSGVDQTGRWVKKMQGYEYTPNVVLSMFWHNELVNTLSPKTVLYLLRFNFSNEGVPYTRGTTGEMTFFESASVYKEYTNYSQELKDDLTEASKDTNKPYNVFFMDHNSKQLTCVC